MFSFHRPKVYRSSTGCCICKAKSSSSRFTDSKKYEDDFMECFKLAEARQGEICNACVLLVKRWKKLPAGSDRNWKHVVDARAGPGMKSMSKFKSKNKKAMDEEKTKKKNIHFEREYSPVSDKSGDDVDMMMIGEVDFMCEDGGDGPSGGSSRTNSPRESDNEETVVVRRRHKALAKRRSASDVPDVSDFISSDYWKREQVCCGVIFRGLCGEVMVDGRFLKACTARLAKCKLVSAESEAKNANEMNKNGEVDASTVIIAATTKLFSDSSSDSGYDESSNQGTSGFINNNNNINKKQQLINNMEKTTTTN